MQEDSLLNAQTSQTAQHEAHSHGKGHVHGPHCSHGPSIPTYVRPSAKVGRNDPCPCGSQQKYKKCHGKEA